MAANDDVLIVGKLDSKELEKSINDLVEYVGDKTTIMAGKFDTAIDKMKNAMKDFAITQKVSVDLMREAWRDMSASFDAMYRAQAASTGGGKGSGKGGYDDNTVGQLEEMIRLEEKRRKEMYLGTDELRKQNQLLDEQREKLRQETTSDPKKLAQQYTKEIQKANAMTDKTLPDAEKKLRDLLRIKNELRATPVLDEVKMERLNSRIQNLINKIRDMRQNAKGNTLKDVLGMDESSVDAIARKMRALKSIKVGGASEMHQLGNEYQRLSRLQAELLGKGIQLTHSNNYLAQSFGYIRNRIVYALTLGAVTNFIKQMYEVRGQYEMLERSLGILIDDMRRGSEIFNELNAMALKSPFTLMELATGAKQLLAYNFAEEEVVETTRRLADISAALGVPMERLVYNLGQIRAQTVLTARDARDFANAGLAIVPMLAQMYTEEKRFGDEIVTTAQVFSMMSDRLVTYADVMKVINKVTDEGGKFFDFQAKQAETLRVKMANLTLAWNNMLNEIGQENQDALTLPVTSLKLLFENWRMVYEIVRDIVVLYGLYRARAILVAAVNGTLITQGIISGMFQLGRAVGYVASAWKILTAVVAANPIGAIATVLAGAAVVFGLFNDKVQEGAEYTERFGRAGAKTVADLETYFDTLENISHESSNYKKVMSELNSILGEYDAELVKETDTQEQLNEKRRVGIQLIKEEILERKYLNEVEQGRKEYEAKIEDVRKQLRTDLSDAITENFLGIGTINAEIAEKAPAIANIISDVIERNVTEIAGKTGDEYEKGIDKIFAEINTRMRAIGISESTLSKGWLKNSMFRMFQDDIITDAINNIARAKEELNEYTDALDKAYEVEKKAAADGAGFNDRVEQTQRRLMAAANDTDNFAKKIETLLKEYGGQNVIDFLVKVKTEVPAWMNQKGLTELTQLSARFTALATNAKKAGKTSLNVNGTEFSIEQLFQRAAQYTQAAQNKAADIEARKSSTITKEASNALNEYKSALEAVAVAKNRVKQGTADNTLVTEKEAEAQKKYNIALQKGVSLDELKKAKEGKSRGGAKKDPLGDALTKEIQLITEMQKLYKDYTKAGVDADKARLASANEYQKSLKKQNDILKSFGIKGLDSSLLVDMDARKLRDYYQNLRDVASLKGNTKGVEALEKAISILNVEITNIDYKKITDGLNNELNKLKEDYELAVELDANPELGNMFADMFSIDTSELPHTVEEVISKAQAAVDKALGGKGIFDVFYGDIESFKESQGQSADSELVKRIEDMQKYVRNLWKKDASETIQNWNKLLEKYAEYEYKANTIQNNATKEREAFVKRFGNKDQRVKALELSTSILATDDPTEKAKLIKELKDLCEEVAANDGTKLNIKVAIDKQEVSDLANLAFEEFKKTPEWIVATGNLSGMTEKAIGGLIRRIEQYKKSAKGLTDKQIKEINRALKQLHTQQRQGNPFKAIGNALDEAKERAEEFKPELEKTQEAIKKLEDEEKKEGKLSEEKAKQLKTLKERLEEIKALSDVSAGEIVGFINDAISAASQAVSMFGEMAEAMGGRGMTSAAKTIKDVVGILEKGGQGAAIGAQIGGGYGAIIGAAAGVLTGIVTTFADAWSGNAAITEKVEESNRAVKRLTNTYKELEEAVNDAYGAVELGTKRAVISNKELQLAETKRQLQLEESRKEKNRDEDRIEELKGQIIDLEIEIRNSTKEIVNDLLDISSVGDAAESMVASMIEAFKNGEDYMSAYSDSFENMIDNMIMKAIVGKVIGEKMEEMFSQVEKMAKERADKQTMTWDELTGVNADWANLLGAWFSWGYGGYMKDEDYLPTGQQTFAQLFDYINKKIANAESEEIKKQYEEYLAKLQELYTKAAIPTPEDVEGIRNMRDTWQSEVKEIFDAYMDAFGIEYGQNKAGSTLSALQQGIQGVTETTAGAIEAYLNGVSQQVYLQSDTLMQIRDMLVTFDLDVQVATMSQMLLQLQQSYQVQLAIQNILNGWSNPSGMAVRVEMV